MVKQQAADEFKSSLNARRLLLQGLFDSVCANRKYVVSHDEASAQKTEANWMAQDCANALMLVVDYALTRFLVAAHAVRPKHKRSDVHDILGKVGPKANIDVSIGQAIGTFADMARHFPEWATGGKPFRHNERVLAALGKDQAHDQAAAHFIFDDKVLGSYDEFEKALCQISDGIAAIP